MPYSHQQPIYTSRHSETWWFDELARFVTNRENQGSMKWLREISPLCDVIDGTSNTMLAGESVSGEHWEVTNNRM